MEEYCAALEKSPIPKLMLYSIPGFVTTMNTVIWCREHLKNLTLIDLGEALHFAQETNPIAFRNALAEWYLSSIQR
jgi:haloalkane dehalogenase